MDVNGTRYQLLLGPDDWARCADVRGAPLRLDRIASDVPADARFAYDATRGALTLRPRLVPFRDPPGLAPFTPEQRRGSGRDGAGNWYWVGPDGNDLRVRRVCGSAVETFWPAPLGVADGPAPGEFTPCPPAVPAAPPKLAGLAVTETNYLVVGTTEPGGLLVFDLYGCSPPERLLWPASVPFTPFDLAPAPGGGVWVLDRVHSRFWSLDARFQVVGRDQGKVTLSAARDDDFQPLLPSAPRRSPARTFPTGLRLDSGATVTGGDPVAIEALPDGSVVVLTRRPNDPFSYLERYLFGTRQGPPVSTNTAAAVIDQASVSSFHLVGHDVAFLPAAGGKPDTLLVASASGLEAYAFAVGSDGGKMTLDPQPDFLPMRLFAGKALVAAGGTVYYDFGDNWVPLVAQRRPRYEPDGVLVTPAFDGKEPACVWHRLMLDACLPNETGVRVWSRAADARTDLAAEDWQPEPPPYLRDDGSELPFLGPPSGPHDGTWELLFQRARGRFLQLKLEVDGSGRDTPRVRALRAYYPRFSYLERYLPATFRDEPGSASFLDRFLANVEGVFTATEDRVAAVQVLFDARSAPAGTLDWLAGWLGVALDPNWDEARRRLFLRNASRFFLRRGTVTGIRAALRLAFESCADGSVFDDEPSSPSRPGGVRVVEQFRVRGRATAALAGDPTAEASGFRVIAGTARWDPSQGGEALNRLYRQKLAQAGVSPSSAAYPLQAPAAAAEAAVWNTFSLATLGFVPASPGSDPAPWEDFLIRRYGRAGVMNDAYKLLGLNRHADFTAVAPPDTLPADGAALRDWFQYESVVLAARRTAHRFTVLLPVTPGTAADPGAARGRLDLARRIVDLEKPAHTLFDVKFYWASFRLGEARLGDDTLIDLGGRAPGLLTALTLGQGFLAGSYLDSGLPRRIPGRFVPGRDALGVGVQP